MYILALDLARSTGWARGHAGGVPASGTIRLQQPGASMAMVLGRLQGWLTQELEDSTIDLIATESPLAIRAYQKLGTSESAVRGAYAMHGIVAALAWRYSVPLAEINVLKVRKHFTGSSSHGGRAEGKAATIARCHQLGYMAKDEVDDNQADALALWDYGSVVWGRKEPKILSFFGG